MTGSHVRSACSAAAAVVALGALAPLPGWEAGVAAGALPPVAGAPAAPQDAGPVLTILEPDGEAYLVGDVRLRADVAPADGVEGVEFFVDGSPVCAVSAPPFECVWDAGPRAEARVVRVVARLGGGRRLAHSVRTRERAGAFFSAGTTAVLVPVAVRDRRGRAVEGLTEGDFALFEDGVRQELSFFETADMPLDLVLAVDFSASMANSIEALRFATRRFVDSLAGTARLSLLAFNDRLFVPARQEHDRDVLLAAVDTLPTPFGGTALLDAIVQGLELHGEDFAHKAIVLFSDGDDRDSLTTLETVEQRIRAGQATVYVVTLGRGRAIEGVRTMLGRLTRVSGGRSFPIERIDDLDDALTYIRSDLRDQYFLGYRPADAAFDGAWRRIEVRTGDRRHVVRAREGYVAAPRY
ncbi:MAG: VWA domain-containing protein [Acidobacteria bacterium]|nr:VWA domain-containing protein [Acidobacteriota bacterium]